VLLVGHEPPAVMRLAKVRCRPGLPAIQALAACRQEPSYTSHPVGGRSDAWQPYPLICAASGVRHPDTGECRWIDLGSPVGRARGRPAEPQSACTVPASWRAPGSGLKSTLWRQSTGRRWWTSSRPSTRPHDALHAARLALGRAMRLRPGPPPIAERGRRSGGSRAKSRPIVGRRCGPGRDGSEPGS
jgi:hypothetical protein